MTRLPSTTCLFALIVLSLTAGAAAAAPNQDLVKAELLADTTAVRAGEPFTVGVLFRLKPEWHVYWTNPGDSGAPVTVRFQLPEGFTAGPVQYPVPVRFVQPGDMVGYGYHDALLLTAE